MKTRIGFGYDSHRLDERRDLWLGGIKIPHAQGLLGHSDADVLIHAVCDALLGAAGLRDIGFHFPDDSPETRGLDSKIILRRVAEMLSEKGFVIGNIDATVCAERPKLAPYIDRMRSVIAAAAGLPESDVSVKATTNERMGFVGREEGIAAYAVALIEKR